MTLTPEEIQSIVMRVENANQETPADVHEELVEAGYKYAIEKLAGQTDEQMVEEFKKHLLEYAGYVWTVDRRWERHGEVLSSDGLYMYKMQATYLFSQLSAHFNAQKQEAVEKAREEGYQKCKKDYQLNGDI